MLISIVYCVARNSLLFQQLIGLCLTAAQKREFKKIKKKTGKCADKWAKTRKKTKQTNKVVKVDIIYVYTLCVCCVPTSISRSKAVCTFI